jgi:hypothetical protein
VAGSEKKGEDSGLNFRMLKLRKGTAHTILNKLKTNMVVGGQKRTELKRNLDEVDVRIVHCPRNLRSLRHTVGKPGRQK